jgi:hypothetical protein
VLASIGTGAACLPATAPWGRRRTESTLCTSMEWTHSHSLRSMSHAGRLRLQAIHIRQFVSRSSGENPYKAFHPSHRGQMQAFAGVARLTLTHNGHSSGFAFSRGPGRD